MIKWTKTERKRFDKNFKNSLERQTNKQKKIGRPERKIQMLLKRKSSKFLKH